MKILLLGSESNLGSQFKLLLAKDCQLFNFDKHNLNVLDNLALRQTIAELKPNLLINCVAYNAVDLAENPKQYNLALALNRNLPADLAKLALEFKFTLVHYSSDYVFSGNLEKQSFSETDKANPINNYGQSKFLGEQEIINLKSEGLNYFLIRTSKLFGPKGSSLESKPSFFDIMINLSQQKDILQIVDEELSCFTYTPDLAKSSWELIKSGATTGIYHLINEGSATWYQATQELFRLMSKKIQLEAIASGDLLRVAQRPKFSILQNNKFIKLRSYQDALAEYLKII